MSVAECTNRAPLVGAEGNQRGSASAPENTHAEVPASLATDGDQRVRPALSFEVMPPRSERQRSQMPELLAQLESYDPDYLAITSARGTGWAQGTATFIEQISSTTRLKPLAHLTCTAGPTDELLVWINRFVDSGVRGFLALRGDLNAGHPLNEPGYLPHADALVSLLRRIERRNVARLCAGRLAVGVAAYPHGHPESTNFDQDIDVLAAKARNGADFAITQLFFDVSAYSRLLTQSAIAGVDMPIIPGLMPITGEARLERMRQLSGIRVPEKIRAAISSAGTEAAQYRVGLELTAELATQILEAGAPGLHIYTFNNIDTVNDLTELLPKGRA